MSERYDLEELEKKINFAINPVIDTICEVIDAAARDGFRAGRAEGFRLAREAVEQIAIKFDKDTPGNIDLTEAEFIWIGKWRCYGFEPIENMIFEQTCLRDIADFCERKTTEHKNRRAADKAKGE